MKKVRKAQEEIYRELYNKHKGSPMAVSSESKAHKKLRFDMISRIFRDDNKFSLHDIGMGIGDYYEYLLDYHGEKKIEYSGSEILRQFCDEAENRFPDINFFHRDIAEQPFDEAYDYLIMSGLFHQRRETKFKNWEDVADNILYKSFLRCKKGIAVNFISPFVDF
mgnify:CR=1 FL=1